MHFEHDLAGKLGNRNKREQEGLQLQSKIRLKEPPGGFLKAYYGRVSEISKTIFIADTPIINIYEISRK